MKELPVHPQIEIPVILQTRKEGNPYKWVQFRNYDDGTLTFPQPPIRGAFYLYTHDGEEYHVEYLTTDSTLSKIMSVPCSHWFSKPLDPSSRILNHLDPIRMAEHVDYLVCIQGKLKFISTDNILKDNLPITYWFNDTDIFPIR